MGVEDRMGRRKGWGEERDGKEEEIREDGIVMTGRSDRDDGKKRS